MGGESSKKSFFNDYKWRPFWPTNVPPTVCNGNPTDIQIPDQIKKKFKPTPPHDPRFQQANQTLRCYVMYTDYYRCQKILGKNKKPCEWFKDTYRVICPNEWIETFDRRRTNVPTTFPWHKRDQGPFPGHCYGDDGTGRFFK